MKPYQHQAVDQIADVMNKRNTASAAAAKPALATGELAYKWHTS
jgi:hypothetical protein